MVRLDKNKLFAAANNINIPQVTGTGSGKYSITVVNSDGNGKRITFSKALVEKLGLTEGVSLIPLKDEGILMAAKKLPFERASHILLNSKDKRTAYNAEAVQLITKAFKLDYTNGRTSYSFNNVDFMTDNGMEIAVIQISAPSSASEVKHD